MYLVEVLTTFELEFHFDYCFIGDLQISQYDLTTWNTFVNLEFEFVGWDAWFLGYTRLKVINS